MMKHWKRALVAPVLGCLLLGGYSMGCGGEAPPLPTLESSVEREVLKVTASPEATEATEGVKTWQIHEGDDDLSIRLVGVDEAGRVMIDSELHVELGEDGTLAGISLEGVFPDSGMIRLAPDGSITKSALPEDGRSVRAMGALLGDLQAVDDPAPDKHKPSLACTLAKVKLVLVCGGAIVACILSGGSPATCLPGAGACWNAVMNYLCKCKDKC